MSSLAPVAIVIVFLRSCQTVVGTPLSIPTRSFREVAKSMSPFMARAVMAETASLTPTDRASSSITSSFMSVESMSKRAILRGRGELNWV